MANTNYNCGQQELYIACRIGWNLCRQYLLPLAAYKARYTEGYVVENLASVNAADLLADNQVRYVAAQLLRVDLVNQKDLVADCFQMLKGYINDAYPSEKRKIMYKAAGQQFYEKAVLNNWASVTGLLSAAVPFINDNLATLTANDNMPPAFADTFRQAKTDFEKIHQDFNAADVSSTNQTAEKINANNAIYAAVMSMLADAQIAFRKDTSIASQFIWSTILTQTKGVKASGIAGKIISELTASALKNAKISIPALNKIVFADKDGRFDLSPISAGYYTLIIEADEHEPITVEHYEVKIGTTGRLNLNMKNILPANAPISQN